MGVTVVRWLRLPPPVLSRWIVPGPVEAAIAAAPPEPGPIAAIVGPRGPRGPEGGPPGPPGPPAEITIDLLAHYLLATS